MIFFNLKLELWYFLIWNWSYNILCLKLELWYSLIWNWSYIILQSKSKDYKDIVCHNRNLDRKKSPQCKVWRKKGLRIVFALGWKTRRNWIMEETGHFHPDQGSILVHKFSSSLFLSNVFLCTSKSISLISCL